MRKHREHSDAGRYLCHPRCSVPHFEARVQRVERAVRTS
jgi:hypothetical protein